MAYWTDLLFLPTNLRKPNNWKTSAYLCFIKSHIWWLDSGFTL